jgi:hypothetical protein
MPTQTHPIDAPAILSRIAAFILIVGLVLAVAAHVHPRSGSMPSPDATATEAVAEWGD